MAAANLIDWFQSGQEPWMDLGDALELLQWMHPRTMFIKSLPRHASLLDVGAGDGALHLLKQWLKPERRDLTLYAYAMIHGVHFEKYDGYELGEWPRQKPDFGGRTFDAILSSHFIEHIPGPLDFIKWSASRLTTNGRLYLEWPSENAKAQSPRDVYRNVGLPILASNYKDDLTHRELPRAKEVLSAIRKAGMQIEHQGVISNPFIEEEILALHKNGRSDDFSLQAAFWSKTKWAQYVVASMPEVPATPRRWLRKL